MKIFLFVLLALTSVSGFADASEFERGYFAGKVSCQLAQEAWVCKMPVIKNETRCDFDNGTFSVGKSKAEAILKFDRLCLKDAQELGIDPICKQID